MILNTPATKATPEIKYDSLKNLLVITGESYPEDAVPFYRILLDQTQNHLQENHEPFTVDFHLNYFNTSSAKRLYEFMQCLEIFQAQRQNITLNWYYEKDDEDMYESGVDFSLDINIPINLISFPA